MDSLLTPDKIDDRPKACILAFGLSNVDTLLQRPVNGVVQLLNQGLGEGTLPELKLLPKSPEYEAGSAEWYFAQLGTTTAVIGELFLLRAAGRGIASKVGLTSLGTKLGLVEPLLGGTSKQVVYGMRWQAAENLALGMAYEGIFRPVHQDEMHEFWSARLKNATSGGMTLMALGASTRSLEKLGEKLVPSSSYRFSLFAPRQIAVGAAGGFFAGVTNASTRSLLSDGEFRTADILNSGKAYASMGAFTFGGAPLLLDPVQKTTLNPEKQKSTLMKLATDHGVGEEMSGHLQLFEERAQTDRLSRQEFAATLANTANLLRRNAAEGVSQNDLPNLSVQCLRQAANPRLTDQGVNGTCNVTTIEGRLYSVRPSDAVRVVADLATKGRFQTLNGSVALKPDQLAPDDQAKKSLVSASLANFDSGARPYSSQLFQLGAVNSYWQQTTHAPDGQTVERGQIEYQLRPDGAGPAAPLAESIVINRPGAEPQILTLNGERIRSPKLGLPEMLQIERSITGRVERRQRMIDVFSTRESTNDVFKPSGVDDLKTNLAKLKAEGRFPITLGMDVRQDPFWKKINGDTPIGVTSFQDNGYHVLQIVDYDAEKNQVFIDGSWGTAKDFLGKPDGKPAMTVEEVWQIMQEGSDKVTSLWIWDNKKFTESAVARAQSWTNLKNANLRNTSLTDGGLSYFSKLTKIEEFGMEGSRVSDIGLRQLKDLSAMKSLNVGRTDVTDASLEVIAGFKNLESLSVYGTGITHEKLAASDVCKNLKLKLLNVSMEDMDQGKFDALKAALRPDCTLGLFMTDKDRATARNVWAWTNAKQKVQGLSSYGGDNAGKFLEAAAKFPELKYLTMSSMTVESAALLKLAACPGLTSLKLTDAKNLTAADFALIPQLSNLTHLDLSKTKVQSLGLERFPKVGALILKDSDVNDVSLQGAHELSDLHSIDLSGTKVTDDAAYGLQCCDRLTTVIVSNTAITTDGARALLALPKLGYLNLNKTKVSDEFLADVNGTRIYSLGLARTGIGDAGIKHLRGSARLWDLNLRFTQITNACLDDLATISNLRTLDLSSTKIDGEGLKKLAPLKLRELNVENTNLDDSAVDTLVALAAVERLRLTDTKVTMDGLRKLSRSGKTAYIYVSFNDFTAEQVKELETLNPKCRFLRTSREKESDEK